MESMPTPKQPVQTPPSLATVPVMPPNAKLIKYDELWDVTTDPHRLDPLSRAILNSLDMPTENASIFLLQMRARHLAFAVSSSASDTTPNRALLLRFFSNTAGAPEAVASVGTEDVD